MGVLVNAVLLMVLLLCSSHPALAQANSRKLKSRVDPVYPELAKRNNIRGSARVELLITQDGRVKDVRVIGGHPILVEAVMEI
jgi:outer membrane biosynthesis protein TonB